jgi:hypothetical protein
MIDLTQSLTASPLVHTAPSDPGTSWTSHSVAIDAPPDSDPHPAPDAEWSTDSVRTGVCGAVAPRVLALPEGGFRMYYTQILPRKGFPAGANDYDNATTRILSATSSDGVSWTPEPGVRLSAQQGGAGNFRVVSSEVVPQSNDSGGLRMYYECCAGPQSKQNSIRSAVSTDGLNWTVEPATRLEFPECNLSAPRILFLDDGRIRLFCAERGTGIISAISTDDGLTFTREPGIRIAPDQQYDHLTAFAPEIQRLPLGGYRMYYAGYSNPKRADILTSVSEDGLTWQKSPEPVHSPGTSPWDAAKCSEMCVLWNPKNPTASPQFRLLHEACDGTTQNQRGIWRITTAIRSDSQS